MISREKIFRYAKKKYGVEPDYPLPIAQSFPVLRHTDNRKWFTLIMDVPKEKLGLHGADRVDIINVKLSDPLLVDLLVHQEGYFRGYHIRGGNWVSILLDGTVPFKDICRMIDESFLTTASKQKKQIHRPPKEWLVPANPKYYDIEHAFDSTDEIDWKQGNGIRVGDTVFMYVAAPVSAILFQCVVTKTEIPYEFSNEALTITSLMKIKLTRRYQPDQFSFDRLRDEYGIFAVRGPRGVPHSLGEALKK